MFNYVVHTIEHSKVCHLSVINDVSISDLGEGYLLDSDRTSADKPSIY